MRMIAVVFADSIFWLSAPWKKVPSLPPWRPKRPADGDVRTGEVSNGFPL